MKPATIHIKDEVNCSIINLDLNDRKHLVNKYKFFDPANKYIPSVRLGRWDGKVSFFSLSGSTYVSLLPELVEFLDNRGYDLDVLDDRKPMDLNFKKISADFWGDKIWPENHRLAGQKITLTDFQVDAANRYLESPQGIQELATGFGKTMLCTTLSKTCEHLGRTLVIVPSKSLVVQTEADYINCGLDVGVFYGDRKDWNRKHVISTWQSIEAMEKAQKSGSEYAVTPEEFFDNLALVIVDECHGTKGSILRKILATHLKNVPLRWGMTGTVPKEEVSYYSLRTMIGPMIGQTKAKELQDADILSHCEIKILQTLEYREFSDFREEVNYLTSHSPRIKWISEQIQEASQTGNVLVLVNHIKTGKAIKSHIPNSVFMSGVTSVADRKEEFDEMNQSNDKVTIATYGIAAVGISVNRLHHVFLIEAGKSFTRVIQSIGRGLRRAADKDFVTIWDITASTKYSKKHLTTRKKFYKDAQYPFQIKQVAIKED